MTPERLSLLQGMLKTITQPWTYDDTVMVREPVNFTPRWPKDTVVYDLPVINKVAFTLRTGRVAMFHPTEGYPFTPSFNVVWVEAEGIVIEAFSFDDEGDRMAADMIGCPCPKCRR